MSNVHFWFSLFPKLECSDPLAPADGEVQADGSVAVYSCLAGYNMEGVSKRFCQAEGNGWDGTAPTCGNQIYSF